jgi:hypothetical protein
MFTGLQNKHFEFLIYRKNISLWIRYFVDDLNCNNEFRLQRVAKVQLINYDNNTILVGGTPL